MKSKGSKEIVEKLNKRYKVTYEEILNIIETPYRVQYHNMNNPDAYLQGIFPNLKISGFGNFIFGEIGKKRRERLLEIKKRKNEEFSTE